MKLEVLGKIGEGTSRPLPLRSESGSAKLIPFSVHRLGGIGVLKSVNQWLILMLSPHLIRIVVIPRFPTQGRAMASIPWRSRASLAAAVWAASHASRAAWVALVAVSALMRLRRASALVGEMARAWR